MLPSRTISVKEKPIKNLLGNDFTLLRLSGQLTEQQFGTWTVLADFPNFSHQSV